jgi:hypothetical protein
MFKTSKLVIHGKELAPNMGDIPPGPLHHLTQTSHTTKISVWSYLRSLFNIVPAITVLRSHKPPSTLFRLYSGSDKDRTNKFGLLQTRFAYNIHTLLPYRLLTERLDSISHP